MQQQKLPEHFDPYRSAIEQSFRVSHHNQVPSFSGYSDNIKESESIGVSMDSMQQDVAFRNGEPTDIQLENASPI